MNTDRDFDYGIQTDICVARDNVRHLRFHGVPPATVKAWEPLQTLCGVAVKALAEGDEGASCAGCQVRLMEAQRDHMAALYWMLLLPLDTCTCGMRELSGLWGKGRPDPATAEAVAELERLYGQPPA